MGKMSLSIYMKRDYEDFCAFGLRKNKANSKPNKPNQSLTPTEQEGFREDTGRQTPVVSAWHLRMFDPLLSEQEGFEPPLPFGKTVFKTVALSRSATAPSYLAYFTTSRPGLQEN